MGVNKQDFVTVTMPVGELLAAYTALDFVVNDQMAEGLFPTAAAEREALRAVKKLRKALQDAGCQV